MSSRAVFPQTLSDEFEFHGKPIEGFHCAPAGDGRHPAVVLLHGAGFRGAGNDQFLAMCTKLAARGYYTEFVEYYDATENSDPNTNPSEDFRAWFAVLDSRIETLGKNPAVDPNRVAVMGFSQGAYLAAGCGALFPQKVAAVVEYYGGLLPQLHDKAKTMPPTLIIHGDGDSIVPVSEAKDLDQMLTKAARPHEIYIYHQAEHGFNFHRPGLWFDKDDTDDAWNRTLKFLDRTLHNRPAP